jgi:hypothetical protein
MSKDLSEPCFRTSRWSSVLLPVGVVRVEQPAQSSGIASSGSHFLIRICRKFKLLLVF